MVTQPKPPTLSSERNFSLLRWIGYGLLVMMAFDVVAIFIPSNFTDANWELQVVGGLAERIGVPLVALGFIFVGETTPRERAFLKPLAWLAFLAGLAYIMLIPLGLSATKRINDQTSAQIASRVTQQLNEVQQRKEQLNRVTPRDLDNVFAQLQKSNRIQGVKSPQELKERLFTEVAKAEEQIKQQSEKVREDSKSNLLKNSLKWCLTSLVGGGVFLFIWWTATRTFKREDLRFEQFEQQLVNSQRDAERAFQPRFVTQEEIDQKVDS